MIVKRDQFQTDPLPAILKRSGLISVTRQSRSMIYRAELSAVRQLVLFLLQDCCNGQPELYAPLIADLTACCTSPAGCAPARDAATT